MRHVNFLCALVLMLVLGFAASARAYNLAGIADAADPGNGWVLNGPDMTGYFGAITNTANFGPSGIVNVPITATPLDTVDASSLSGKNGFVSSWWGNGNTPAASVTAVQNFFLSGHDLYLMDDDSDHDAIGAALGIPTSASDGSLSSGTGPLTHGPFGIATGISQSGDVGMLDAADIAATNGHVDAVNASGEITAAYWNAGDYAPGAGRLVIIADVDMVSNDDADYTALNANAIFGLDTTAFLVTGALPITPSSAVPLPAAGPAAAAMLAVLAMVGVYRRRRAVQA